MKTPKLIVIKYPPDFDGELHITCTDKDNYAYNYNFTHANQNGELDEWQTLVKAAWGIINQDRRLSK